jgi:alkylhydroperoxidase family enzyme
MARIPYRSEGDTEIEELVAAIRSRRGGDILNLDRMLLHSPPYAKGWNWLLGAVRRDLDLGPGMRELVVCAIAKLTGAEYEWQQHAPLFLKAGGKQAQLDALGDVAAAAANANLFSEKERAALQITLESTRDIRVSDATFAQVRKHFPDRQVMELVGTIAAYNMVARFLIALGVDDKNQ